MKHGVDLGVADDVATITLNRPEKRNALSIEDLGDLSAALDDAAAVAGLRALVLTGAGDRAFSGGVDLGSVGEGAASWDDNPLTALCDKLESFPRPTIARLNGAVVGGSVEMSLACDFRVAAGEVPILVPATKIGVHYEAAGLDRARRVLGLQAARRIYLLAEKMDAATWPGSAISIDGSKRVVSDAALADLLTAIRARRPSRRRRYEADPDGAVPRGSRRRCGA